MFAVLILAALWFLQIVFLNRFYESMKISEVTKVGDYLRSEYGNEGFETKVLNYSQKKGMTIEVIDEDGHLIYPLSWVEVIMNPKVINEEDFNDFFDGVHGVNGGTEDFKISKMKYKDLDNPTVVYAGYLGKNLSKDYYIMIRTVLQPVDSTTDILQRMLGMVSVLSLILSLILSYFISRRLSRPLVKMSRTARILGSGNYKVHFEDAVYTEIDDLAKTLNYATNELTKTIEVRKDLIANVSHDLKTPLTVIKSYGEMIKDISGNNEEMRNRHIQTIISEAEHLTYLVNDLLDLSKIESNLEKINLQPENLAQIARDSVERFQIASDRYDYEFNIEEDGYTTILCDKKRIEQVLYNLINNAINYSKKEKSVTLKIYNQDNKVHFHCIDKGVGIEEDKLSYVWDRFYRVRDNHTRPKVGTGLGLSIVKNILEIHNFEYGVNSKFGEGSDFYFIAPQYNLKN